MNEFSKMHQARIMGEVAGELYGLNIARQMFVEKMARALLDITEDVRMSDDGLCTLTAWSSEHASAPFITVQVH